MRDIKLSDGRVIARRNPKVRDMANAENQGKNKNHLVKYAFLAAKITIDGKPAVIEDVLDTMTEEDILKINTLFTEDEEKE